MERWDEDGPISRLRATLDAGNLPRREKFNLYAIVSTYVHRSANDFRFCFFVTHAMT